MQHFLKLFYGHFGIYSFVLGLAFWWVATDLVRCDISSLIYRRIIEQHLLKLWRLWLIRTLVSSIRISVGVNEYFPSSCAFIFERIFLLPIYSLLGLCFHLIILAHLHRNLVGKNSLSFYTFLRTIFGFDNIHWSKRMILHCGDFVRVQVWILLIFFLLVRIQNNAYILILFMLLHLKIIFFIYDDLALSGAIKFTFCLQNG